MLHSLLRLARAWAAVEHRRFNMIDQGEREAVFPINSEHCASSAQSILDLMQKLNEQNQVTFLFSTHDPIVMERARRIVRLRDGRLESDDRLEGKQ